MMCITLIRGGDYFLRPLPFFLAARAASIAAFIARRFFVFRECDFLGEMSDTLPLLMCAVYPHIFIFNIGVGV